MDLTDGNGNNAATHTRRSSAIKNANPFPLKAVLYHITCYSAIQAMSMSCHHTHIQYCSSSC